jgi:glycosyltransferase involved in cell wall biosynthesis
LKILILSDLKQIQGGTNEVIKNIINVLNKNHHNIVVDHLAREKYLPKYLPKRWIDLFRIFYLHNISKDDYFKQFDLVITLHPDSHCIKHTNHIIYFQHHLKQYYDLFWYSYRQKKKVSKKIVFLLLTAINRLADKTYLTPSLKNSHVIVNSQTVGDRLKKYNKIYNFEIINPGCPLPRTDTIEKIKIQDTDSTIAKLGETNTNPSHKNLVILSFSRLNVPQKGIAIIFNTALLMPSYQFIIAGPYDITLKTIDKSSIPKNIVLIVKDFSVEEKDALFKTCDVFIAPYLEEDFGITPIEANAYGKPVVYCDDSGEIVRTQKHKTTGYMSSRNAKDLVEGIKYCIKNKDEMKNACINNALNYTVDKFETSFRKYLFQLRYNDNNIMLFC